MLFPIVGALLYIVIGGNLHKSKVLKAIKQSEEKGNKYFIQDEKIKKEIESQNNGKINYLMNYLNFPVTKNNNINYYKLGELAYPEMLKELKNAKKFIFLEYFNMYIIDIATNIPTTPWYEKFANSIKIPDKIKYFLFLLSNHFFISPTANMHIVTPNNIIPFSINKNNSSEKAFNTINIGINIFKNFDPISSFIMLYNLYKLITIHIIAIKYDKI